MSAFLTYHDKISKEILTLSYKLLESRYLTMLFKEYTNRKLMKDFPNIPKLKLNIVRNGKLNTKNPFSSDKSSTIDFSNLAMNYAVSDLSKLNSLK
jgi:hypothetical protein